MAKTIHDLAVAYGKEHQGTVDIEIFETGANAVLSEIKSILSDPINYVIESGWQGQLNDVVGMIRQRIKELRGE